MSVIHVDFSPLGVGSTAWLRGCGACKVLAVSGRSRLVLVQEPTPLGRVGRIMEVDLAGLVDLHDLSKLTGR